MPPIMRPRETTPGERRLLSGGGGPGAPPSGPPAQGTGYYSISDGHELTIDELYNSPTVRGSDNLIYTVVLGKDPYTNEEFLNFELAPQWAQDEDGGAGGWRPGELELTQAADRRAQREQEASNMVNYLDQMARGVELEMTSRGLSVSEAAAEFDRRLAAFSEAGSQMASMWQWTMPMESAGKPIHADIRERLDMEPWISKPVEYDPVGEAQKILASMPPTPPVTSAQPFTDALKMAERLVG